MDTLGELYEKYSQSVAKAQEHYQAKDKLMPKAQEVIPGKELEAWVVTDEKIEELERLERLYEAEQQIQLEILKKIALIKSRR